MSDVYNASKKDLEVINEYFKDSGRVFTEEDNITVHEDTHSVAFELYEDDILKLLADLEDRKPIDENISLLENLIDELQNVFQSPDSGMYYVIK